jgi:hypothetical protein
MMEMVNEAMHAYEFAPASELKLTTSGGPTGHQALKVGKALSPNGIPYGVLRHIPKHAITFFMKMFNALLCRQYFPPAWKHG